MKDCCYEARPIVEIVVSVSPRKPVVSGRRNFCCRIFRSFLFKSGPVCLENRQWGYAGQTERPCTTNFCRRKYGRNRRFRNAYSVACVERAGYLFAQFVVALNRIRLLSISQATQSNVVVGYSIHFITPPGIRCRQVLLCRAFRRRNRFRRPDYRHSGGRSGE